MSVALEESLETLTLEPADLEMLSPFDGLPRDIVWMIIDYAQEAISELRLTSQATDDHVNDYVLLRPIAMPLVKELEILKESRNILSISMLVPASASKMLAMRLASDTSDTPIDEVFTRMPFHNDDGDEMIEYNIRLYDRLTNKEAFEHLKDCMGRMVEKTKIQWSGNKPMADSFAGLIEGLEFGQLSVMDGVSEDAVMHLVTEHKVNHLTMTVKKIATFDPKRFLLKLASNVQSLRICQQWAGGVRHGSSYLFGLHDADWPSIVLEMFSKKLDKLCIENCHYVQYLNAENAEELKKRLPECGKDVWFEATCNNDVQLGNFIEEEYSFKVTTLENRRHKLKIKHASREFEQF